MMNNYLPIFMIFGILCTRTSADFATVEDVSPIQLENLTPEGGHKLMLKKLSTKGDKILTDSFFYEILSASVGNEFFSFSQDENITRTNNAIIKAMVECLKKLPIQDRVEDLLFKVSANGPRYLRTSGSFSAAFSLICSDVDFFLKNETFYTTFKDVYEKQRYLPPSKIYHYDLAKSPKDEYKAIEELLNEPQIKPLMTHLAWVWISRSSNSKLKGIKNSIVKLAKVPDIAEEVQTIYEQLIDEVTPLIKHIDFYLFQTPGNIKKYFQYEQQNLTERLWSKISKDIPDWADYMECDIADINDETNLYRSRGARCEKAHLQKQDLIYKNAWPVTSDFNASSLQNQTRQQQHSLFLKELAKKNSTQIYKLLFLELLAKSIGNDFFSFVKDEKLSLQNNAIVKSAFDCIPNLLLTSKVEDVVDKSLKKVSEYIAEKGNVEEGFSQLCSNIDELMRNETFYTAKRNEYLKQNISLPTKTYQYDIGKPTEDQRKIIKESFNDPKLKKFWAHKFWINANFTFTTYAEEGKTKYSILQMATIPSKSEAVQRIYDQSIEDSIHLIKNFTSDEINVGISTTEPVTVNPKVIEVFQTFLIRQIISNIKRNKDISTIFYTLQHFLSHKGDITYSYQP